ncbi:ABC transporter permease [Novosphingobium flavum]|uniref:ABC transporter permease n=1 Tax=Novosphingobium flavum TaxID=1778672 RepID=A0A7X1KL39_9SPHN|nr:FtsX-like permease family protein [Novosphingobium flavum]MBC2664830.1 ABC transporter permease [Novosphingobium flavum]
MAGRLGLLLHVAARHLLVRRRQTAVAVSGVAVGVGFFLAVSAMMIGSQRDFVKTLIDAAPHIVISDELRSPAPQPGLREFGKEAAVQLHGYKVRTEVRGIKDWQQILREVDAIPGAIGSPSLSGAVTLRLGGRDEALAVIGIDPGIESRVSTISEKLRSGRLIDLEKVQGGVIIGEDQAQRLGLGMGDIVAATPARGGTRTLRIVGLFKKGQQLGSNAGYMLLREAQSLLGRPFVINRIGVKLPDPYTAEAIAAALERRHAYKAESWQERSSDFLGLLLTRNIIMYSVVSAILLVASFGIYTAVSTSVADKRRDIAIMRSIGFSEGDLQLIFVLEGLALAVAGVVVGWLLGSALLEILGSIKITVQGTTMRVPLDRTTRQYLIAAAASLLAGVVAAWLPARKAARVDPVEILRGAA